MRVPARWISALACAVLGSVALGLVAACATPSPVKVAYDESEDLSALRTWDWIEGDAVLVRAPSHDAAAIGAELSALVASALAERGFERTRGRAAFRVAAMLVVNRSYQPFRRARAMQTVHSYHDLGNYEVQADEVEQRPIDRMRLAVFMTAAAQERMLWQAELEESHMGGFSDHLDDAVEKLLGAFPPHSRGASPAAPMQDESAR